MKRALLTSVPIFLCLTASIAGRTLAGAPGATAAKTSAGQERIHRIENGLLPAILIKGQDARGMNLIDRMKHYKIPGVSIAFFSHGKILWTGHTVMPTQQR
jgi:hypothetical protein